MNECENRVADKLIEKGWSVSGRGWPDFLCYKDNQDGTRTVMAVEVKNEETGDKLRPDQIHNHLILTGIGLPVYVVKNANDVEGLDGEDSVASFARDTLELFTKQLSRFEERMTTARDSYLKNRTELLDEKIEKWDARYNQLLSSMDQKFQKFHDMYKLLETASKIHISAAADRMKL